MSCESESLNRINDKLITNLTFQRDQLEEKNRDLIWQFKRIIEESYINSDVTDFARYCVMIAESAVKSAQ